jgi:ABC-2 type transport system permease protein
MTGIGALAERIGLPTSPARRDQRRRFWYVVWVTAVATYKRRFAGTVLGYAWTILQPLLLFTVIYAVFTEVLRFGEDIQHYDAMLLINIVFFFWFRRATITSMRSFVASKGIVANVRVPPLAMPLATMVASSFVFGFNILVCLGLAIAFGVTPLDTWLLAPVLVAYTAAIIVPVGVLLACTYVRIRDVAHVYQPIVRLLFYVSGAIFPFALIPDGFFRTIAAVNPLSPLFVQLRVWMLDPSAPDWPDAAGSTLATFLPFITLALLGIASVVVYRVTRTRIAEGL